LGAIYLKFGAICLIIVAKIENRVFSSGVGGGGGWVPQDLQEVSSRCRAKNFRLPLVLLVDNPFAELAAEKIGDSPIKSDMKLGLHLHFGAQSQL